MLNFNTGYERNIAINTLRWYETATFYFWPSVFWRARCFDGGIHTHTHRNREKVFEEGQCARRKRAEVASWGESRGQVRKERGRAQEEEEEKEEEEEARFQRKKREKTMNTQEKSRWRG